MQTDTLEKINTELKEIKNLSKEILKSYEDGRSDDLAKSLRKLHLHINNDKII
jgi:hypothetical protein